MRRTASPRLTLVEPSSPPVDSPATPGTMLAGLAIRDFVLIDRLDIAFEAGLSALTGETGAGKSILLDALGLALGARADSALVRHGAEQAAVGQAIGPGLDEEKVHPTILGAGPGAAPAGKRLAPLNGPLTF